jgi:hypothetical protein
MPTSSPIGIEMQVEAYACNDCYSNNTTFYKFKIINKGTNKLYHTYMANWVDSDLGKYDDDYVQCDVARGMAFTFNGDAFDEGVTGYGINPPALGVDFMKGPLADETMELIIIEMA